jgi:23S rRNA (adenine2503-C2)-methyltransferase
VRGVLRFCRHDTISKDLREKLAARFTIARPEIVEEQISVDGTRKWLLRFPPRGAGRPVEVETVYIPEEGRGTLCVSSQVGCTLTCTFCHTGTQKLVRNLTAEEILSQILVGPRPARRFPGQGHAAGRDRAAEGRKVTNIVMMGMGEPLYNFDNVKKALLIASDGDGLSLSSAASRCRPPAWCRRSSAPATRSACMLAISLHAVRDELRDVLVPINKKYPLKELLDACRGPIRACRTPSASPSNT